RRLDGPPLHRPLTRPGPPGLDRVAARIFGFGSRPVGSVGPGAGPSGLNLLGCSVWPDPMDASQTNFDLYRSPASGACTRRGPCSSSSATPACCAPPASPTV